MSLQQLVHALFCGCETLEVCCQQDAPMLFQGVAVGVVTVYAMWLSSSSWRSGRMMHESQQDIVSPVARLMVITFCAGHTVLVLCCSRDRWFAAWRTQACVGEPP